MGLRKRKNDLLRAFVDNTCEMCRKPEEEVGTLHPHRIRRGWQGGEYILRNIMMVCSKCHKILHANEFSFARSK